MRILNGTKFPCTPPHQQTSTKALPTYFQNVCAKGDTADKKWGGGGDTETKQKTHRKQILSCQVNDLRKELQTECLAFCLRKGASEVLESPRPACGFRGLRAPSPSPEWRVGLSERSGLEDRRPRAALHHQRFGCAD